MHKSILLTVIGVLFSISSLMAQDHPFTSFGLGMDGVVTSIATDSNGNFYFGGMSSVAGTTDIQNITKYDGENWIDIGRTASFVTFVRDMEVAGEYLYIVFQRSTATSATNEIITPGGESISIESGLGAYHIPSDTWTEIELPDNERYNFLSLTSNGSTAYAGSSLIFTLQNGEVDYVAPGKPYAEWGFSGGALHTLEYYDGKLYAGGRFARLYNHEDDDEPTVEGRHVAVFNLETDSWEAVGEGFSDTVYSLHVTAEGDLYAGGQMEEILDGDNAITTNGFAKWDGAGSWEPVGQGIDPEESSSRIESISSEGNEIFVAGRFGYVLQSDGTQVPTENFAVWEGQQWALDEFGNSQTGSGVSRELREPKSENISSYINTSNRILQDIAYKIHNHNGEIYLGGSFDRMRTGPDLMSRVNARNIVKYENGEYYAIGKGVDDVIFDVVEAGEDYYLTGIFVYGYNQGERVKLNGVAKYNTSELTLEPVGEGLGECLLIGPGFRECTEYGSHLIYDEQADDIYVAGRLLGAYQTGGQFVESPMAVRWDGTSWQAMGNGLTPEHDIMDFAFSDVPWEDKRWIFDMQRNGDDIYFAGAFQEIDAGNSDGKLAAIWSMSDEEWQGVPLPEEYDVPSFRSITITDESIYFGARIPDPQDLERFPIVRYDRKTGSSERFNFAAGTLGDVRVNNIISEGDFLYVLSNGIGMVTIDEKGKESEKLFGSLHIYDKTNELWTISSDLRYSYRTVKRKNSIYILTSFNNGQYNSGSTSGNDFFAINLGTTPEVIEDEKIGGFFGASLMGDDSLLLTGSFIDMSSGSDGFVGRSAKVRLLDDQASGGVPILFEREIEKEVFSDNNVVNFQLPVGNLGNESYSGNFTIDYIDGSDWITVSDVSLDPASSGTAGYQIDAGELQPGSYSAVITLNSDNPEIDAISIDFKLNVDPLRKASDPMPEDEEANVALDTNLEWTNDEETTTIKVYFSDDISALDENIIYEGSVVSELTSLPEIFNNTTYYWQVISENSEETNEGEIWYFTTIAESDGLISLIAPENEATDLETEIDFSWSSEESADSYHFQLSLDDQFDNIVIDEAELIDAAYTASNLEEITTYFWRVQAKIAGAESGWSDVWSFTTAVNTSIVGGNEIPDHPFIDQNYPNPFNPTTTINYGMSEAGMVHLSVYNMIGQRVAVLVAEQKNAGHHTVVMDASSLSSGIYFYRFEAGGFNQTRKLTLIK